MAAGADEAASRPRDDAAHEARCRRCGVSCHVAVPVEGVGAVAVPGLRCQFLEPDGDRFACTVYAERFVRAPWCHHADVAAPLGYLATDCPYGSPPGDGKVKLDGAAFDAVWPEVLRKIRSWGVPDYVHRAALLQEVSQRTGRKWLLEPWPGDPERLRLRARMEPGS